MTNNGKPNITIISADEETEFIYTCYLINWVDQNFQSVILQIASTNRISFKLLAAPAGNSYFIFQNWGDFFTSMHVLYFASSYPCSISISIKNPFIVAALITFGG